MNQERPINLELAIKIAKNVSGFEIIDDGASNIPTGLTGDLLYNLWDIGYKFGENFDLGVQYRDDNIWIKILLKEAITEAGQKVAANCGMIITAGNILLNTSQEPDSIFHTSNGLGLIWDSSLEVEHVRQAVTQIDSVADIIGWKTGNIRKLILNKSPKQSD